MNEAPVLRDRTTEETRCWGEREREILCSWFTSQVATAARAGPGHRQKRGIPARSTKMAGTQILG